MLGTGPTITQGGAVVPCRESLDVQGAAATSARACSITNGWTLAAALAAALWATPATAQEASGDEAGATAASDAAAASDDAPWRGSELIYRNTISALTLDPSAELTWNPYYAMSWTIKPRWWFDDVWYAGARLDLTREISEADDTTYAGETQVGDLLLVAGASDFVTVPGAGIDVSADFIVTTPTSKLSQARTLVLGLGPGVKIGRTFDLGGDFSLVYHVRFTSFLDRYTTAETETPIIPTCARSEAGCESFVNTGVRNPQWRVQHGIDLSWQPLEWLGASIGFEHYVDWLYPIAADDPRISLATDSPTDQRHSSAFGFEATFTPLPSLEVGLGYETVSPQLAPDSTYYNPFYNRYTTLYLDLRLEVDGLVAQIEGEA
jgi:hypothetical protein